MYIYIYIYIYIAVDGGAPILVTWMLALGPTPSSLSESWAGAIGKRGGWLLIERRLELLDREWCLSSMRE